VVISLDIRITEFLQPAIDGSLPKATINNINSFEKFDTTLLAILTAMTQPVNLLPLNEGITSQAELIGEEDGDTAVLSASSPDEPTPLKSEIHKSFDFLSMVAGFTSLLNDANISITQKASEKAVTYEALETFASLNLKNIDTSILVSPNWFSPENVKVRLVDPVMDQFLIQSLAEDSKNSHQQLIDLPSKTTKAIDTTQLPQFLEVKKLSTIENIIQSNGKLSASTNIIQSTSIPRQLLPTSLQNQSSFMEIQSSAETISHSTTSNAQVSQVPLDANVISAFKGREEIDSDNQPKPVTEIKSLDKLATSHSLNDPSTSSVVPSKLTFQETEFPKLHSSIISQLSEKIHVLTREGPSEVRLQLQPKSLGQLLIQLRMDGQELSIHILAESSKTQSIIHDNLNHLKTNLGIQGINLENLAVSIGSDASAFDTPDRQSNSKYMTTTTQRSKIFQKDIDDVIGAENGPSKLYSLSAIDYQV
jgi:flagellar hook-length control protein FliK